MYYILNNKTREVLRESPTPFNIDESVQPSDKDLIQLKMVEENIQPEYDTATQKLERVFVDDDGQFTRTFSYVVVAKTAEEQAAQTLVQAETTERTQLKNAYNDLKNGAGTIAQRVARLEKALAWAIRDVARN